jgi:transposase InsO family protein
MIPGAMSRPVPSPTTDGPDTLSPPVRCQLRGKVDDATERFALRAVLTAARLFGLAAGTHLRQLRNLNDPLTSMQARIEEAQLHARLAWEIVEILSSRFRKIPQRHRPHYSPSQRFRALEIKGLLGWSREIAARVFLVCSNTISNWEHSADPHARTVGSTVKPVPPVRRFADTVRATVDLLARSGFGGQDAIALSLAAAGWKVSARSVRRIVARAPRSSPVPPGPSKPLRPVIARFVHHVWMMDVTEVRSFLGLRVFHVAGVFDAFSRVPLALRVCEAKPGGATVGRLLGATARAFGAPKYLITDLGGEFRGRVFARAVRRLGVRQRFASAANLHATARLERFWRTLKDSTSLRLHRPLTIEDLERRLEMALAHYIALRPHQGLHGATPAEAILGAEPGCAAAQSPPRGLVGDGPCYSPFSVAYLDPRNRRFPVLLTAA